MSAWLSCHYRWRLEYIEGHKSQMGIAAAVGQAVHAGVERYYKLRREGIAHEYIVASGEAEDVFEQSYFYESLDVIDPKEPIEKVEGQGRRVLGVYLDEVGRVTEPLLVEHGFLITVNGILYSGHMDLADKPGKVRDLKVLGQPPRDPWDRYLFAMVGYGLGYRDHTGEKETDLQLDVMIRLKRDSPRYVPISNGGPATDQQIGVFAATLEKTAEGIAKGDYRPTGLGIKCPYCPVKNICLYGQAMGGSDNATA